MIAVQVADGSFVPVLDTSSGKRRRVVVTTIRDDQTAVRIGLYRGSDQAMSDAEYVGSLIVEDIEPSQRGTPDITVVLGMDDAHHLSATATDTRSGEYQSLSIGLDRLDADDGFDLSDVQLAEEGDLDELSFDDIDVGAAAFGESGLDEGSAGEPSLDEFADESFSFDESLFGDVDEASPEADLEAGLEEADLGEEDFTFDEGGEQDEPLDLGSDALLGSELDEEQLFADLASGDEDEINDTLSPEEFGRLDSEPAVEGPMGASDLDEAIEPRRSNAFIFVGYIVLAIAALAVLTYLVFRLLEGPPAPPLRADVTGQVSLAILFLSVPAGRVARGIARRTTSRRSQPER